MSVCSYFWNNDDVKALPSVFEGGRYRHAQLGVQEFVKEFLFQCIEIHLKPRGIEFVLLTSQQ